MLRTALLLLALLCLTGCPTQEPVPASFKTTELQPGVHLFTFDPGRPSQAPTDTLFVSHLNQWLEQNPAFSVTKIEPLQRNQFDKTTRVTSYLVVVVPKSQKKEP